MNNYGITWRDVCLVGFLSQIFVPIIIKSSSSKIYLIYHHRFDTVVFIVQNGMKWELNHVASGTIVKVSVSEHVVYSSADLQVS